jgi:hypothetical protein
MRISKDKLKAFDNEGDLRAYLKINGISGTAIDEHIAEWNSSDTTEKPTKKVTMVTTETDTTVETK